MSRGQPDAESDAATHDATTANGDPAELRRLRNKALRLLSQREYSERDLLAKLAQPPSPFIAKKIADRNARRAKRETTETPRDDGASVSQPAKNNAAMQQFLTRHADSPDPLESAPKVQISSFSNECDEDEAPKGGDAHARSQNVPSAQIVSALKAAGYQSDARFAASVVRRRGSSESERSVRERLKSSGVEIEMIATALEAREMTDESAVAALWARKFGTPPANDKEKARQIRFLQSKGFGVNLILKTITGKRNTDFE